MPPWHSCRGAGKSLRVGLAGTVPHSQVQHKGAAPKMLVVLNIASRDVFLVPCHVQTAI